MHSETVILEFTRIAPDRDDQIATVAINRPEAANAFSAEVVDQLLSSFDAVAGAKACRAVVLRGKGKHFCAGADLNWMKASVQLTFEENLSDAKHFMQVFERLTDLPMPTIGIGTGAVYGGGVGLIACCDFAIADVNAKFCLSEIRLGILPAVILPYVARKIHHGQLRRLALSGRIFSGEEAKEFGLVEVLAPANSIEAVLKAEINELLQGSPEAQLTFKSLHKKILFDSFKQGEHTVETIAKTRVTAAGQAGLKSFIDRVKASWVTRID